MAVGLYTPSPALSDSASRLTSFNCLEYFIFMNADYHPVCCLPQDTTCPFVPSRCCLQYHTTTVLLCTTTILCPAVFYVCISTCPRGPAEAPPSLGDTEALEPR